MDGIHMPVSRGELRRSGEPSTGLTPGRAVLLWFVFFLICLGLGYAPLNRFDPRQVEGTSDVAAYGNIVVGNSPQPSAHAGAAWAGLARFEHYYRLLVPYVAKPFYWLARGRVGSWDAALLGLLLANAIFTATTATLLVAIARRWGADTPTALLGAALFLLNYAVINFYLVGMVDSAEACFLLAIAWSLLTGRWFLLPLWGVFGALAKETFAPIAVMFALGWWVSEMRRDRLEFRRLAWAGALGVTSLGTVTITMSTVVGRTVWPWQFALMYGASNFLTSLCRCLIDHTFWYIFIWLLPLGLLRLRRLPRSWVMATGVAFCGTLAIGAYHNMGDTARPLFNVAGPILSLSAAIFLAGSSKTPPHPPQSTAAEPNERPATHGDPRSTDASQGHSPKVTIDRP
jgi:hypothetical protein